MNTTRHLLLALAFMACASPSCAPLTPAQQAKLSYTEKLAAGLGDKVLKVGVLTGYITPAEANAAREIGNLIITPAPVPAEALPSAKNPKNPLPGGINPPPFACRFLPREAVDLRADAPTGPPLFG